MKILVLAAIFFLSACSYGSSNLIDRSDEEISQKIVVDKTTKAQILKEFGVPMAKMKMAGNREKWIYSEAKMAPIPFAKAKKKTLEIYFNKQGRVIDYAWGGMEGY